MSRIARPRGLAALSPTSMRTPAKRRGTDQNNRMGGGGGVTQLSPMATAAAAASARARRERQQFAKPQSPLAAPTPVATAAPAPAAVDENARNAVALAEKVARAYRRHIDETLYALQSEMAALASFEKRLDRGRRDVSEPISVMHSQRYLLRADAALTKRGAMHDRLRRHIQALQAKCQQQPLSGEGREG